MFAGRLMSAMLLLMIGVMHSLGKLWGRLRIKLSKPPVYRCLLNIVRIVAFCAYPPSLLAACYPHTCPLAVYAVSPVAVDLPVALSTELLGLIKADLIVHMVIEFVTVCTAMTLKTPYSAPAVPQ